jgi:nitroreductase
MDFSDVVARRRMVRNFADRPVDPEVVQRVLTNALHAPSAGFSQGWGFLLLDNPDAIERYWAATTRDGEPDRWLRGMRRAPVLIVAMSNKKAYLDRYAEPDKGWTDRDEARWSAPYWDIDTGMAAMLILLTAVDAGLGALFFGVPVEKIDTFREAFGVPSELHPIGVVAVGYPKPSDPPSPSLKRGWRSSDQVVHRGRW